MSHDFNVDLSGPVGRDYNLVDFLAGDDVELRFDLSRYDEWIDTGLNLTIYTEKDRETIMSIPLEEEIEKIVLNDFAPEKSKRRAIAVIEDRTDPNNIDAKETIAYFVWVVFPGGTTITDQLGYGSYLESDDTTITIPHFQTRFGEGANVDGYVNFVEENGNVISVPIYNQAANLV